jgi:hypothetical protein
MLPLLVSNLDYSGIEDLLLGPRRDDGGRALFPSCSLLFGATSNQPRFESGRNATLKSLCDPAVRQLQRFMGKTTFASHWHVEE